MREPLLLPLAAIIAGILMGRALDFTAAGAAWPIPVFAALYWAGRYHGARRIGCACIALSLLFLGVWTEAWHRPAPPPIIEAGARETVALQGCVVEPAVFSADREQFTLELDPGARVRVTLPIGTEDAAIPRVHYGQRVEIDARIRRPRNFRNPGAFDYEQYLARKQIYWTASMQAGTSTRVLPGRCGSRARGLIFALREAALDRLDELYSGDVYTSGMMQAILIGENAKLERIWTETFRRTGTVHALVISGAHVAVLAGVLLFLLRLCALQEIPALALAATGAWLYALITGFSPPVVRAAAGFTLYLAARFLFRKARVLNILSAIGIVYLIADPAELFDPSFQLSFLAAAALGAFGLPLMDSRIAPLARGLRGVTDAAVDAHLQPRTAQLRVEVRLAAEGVAAWARIPGAWISRSLAVVLRGLFYAGELAILSAVIQIGLALPMIQYFHRVSITGLTANLVIVPLLETAVPVGFFAIFTGWQWPAAVAGWLVKIAARTADWHAGWEPSNRVADPPLWLGLALAAAFVVLAVALRHGRGRWLVGGMTGGLFVLLVWHPWAAYTVPGTLEMTVIDVGQGDSILMVFPGGGTMLIDGGGILRYGRRTVIPRLDTGEDVVSPYLWARGIKRLDIVAVTHAHADHSGGISALLRNFHPAELWLGSNPSPVLVQQAAQNGIHTFGMRAAASREFSGAKIQVLSPPMGYVSSNQGNNDSLVFRVTYGERSFLLTGDMERAMEGRLLSGREIDLKADVLKVGHHGSRTSTTPDFLAAVAPSIAVISAGFENSFGHPHRDVLHRLAERGVTLLRTDTGGLATVRTDGRKLWLDTMLWRPIHPAGLEFPGLGPGLTD